GVLPGSGPVGCRWVPNGGGSPKMPRLMPSAASIAAPRNTSWSIAHRGSLVNMPQPSVMLGNEASLWFSISVGRGPTTHSAVGVTKKTSAQISATSCRPPCRGRCSACSRGSHASCTGGSRVESETTRHTVPAGLSARGPNGQLSDREHHLQCARGRAEQRDEDRQRQ